MATGGTQQVFKKGIEYVGSVLAAGNVAGGATADTSYVDCFGARAVVFWVRSTTDNDAFATTNAAEVLVKMGGVAKVSASGVTVGGLGVDINLNAAITANVGALVHVSPFITTGGSAYGFPFLRIVANECALRIKAGAAQVDNVTADAWVIWD